MSIKYLLCKFILKDNFFLDPFFFSLSQDSEIMIMNITMDFYGVKMHLCMESKQKIEQFVNMYNSCDVLLLSNRLQKAQQHQHTCTCRKKNHVVYKFRYPLPSTCERKIS
jgi:hypothetical protein